jgi:hypothetical protein
VAKSFPCHIFATERTYYGFVICAQGLYFL